MHNNTIESKLIDILKIIGVESDLEKVEESPQLTNYCFNVKNSKDIVKINNKTIEIIGDYVKTQITLNKNQSGYSFIISIPNATRKMVLLNSLSQPANTASDIKLNVGVDTHGSNLTLDFNKINHMLVAGTTGSGKSVFINSILCALIKSTNPSDYDLKLIDPKRVSFNVYKNLSNVELITEMEDASDLFDDLIDIMEERYKYMEEAGITDKNIFKPTFVVVDELAELMAVNRDECEPKLIRLLQKARQANIHIILATQRPTADIISGLVKAQCDTRICLKMAGCRDSITVLDKGGGEHLLGYGDALVKFPYLVSEFRVQTAYIPDDEVKNLVTSVVEATTSEQHQSIVNTSAIMGSGQIEKVYEDPVQGQIQINDPGIRELIETCVNNLKSWGIDVPEGITWKEEYSDEWYGIAYIDKKLIVLNKDLNKFNTYRQTDTIYHELCHIISKEKRHRGEWEHLIYKIQIITGKGFNYKPD